MTAQEQPGGWGADGPALSLTEEIRLLAELVLERAAPWLESLAAAGHRAAGVGNQHSAAGVGDQHSAAGVGDQHGAAEGLAGADPLGAPELTDDPAGAQHHGPAWCPLCAVLAVTRGERPELAAGLLDQAAQLVALLRAVLADRWAPQEGVHMPGFTPARPPGPQRDGSPRVQHIAVRRRADWQRGGDE